MHSNEICPHDYGATNHGVAPNRSSVCHYLSVIYNILLVELVLLLNLEPGVESLLGLSWNWAGFLCALLYSIPGTQCWAENPKNMWEETPNDASYLEILPCMARSTLSSHWIRWELSIFQTKDRGSGSLAGEVWDPLDLHSLSINPTVNNYQHGKETWRWLKSTKMRGNSEEINECFMIH